MQPDPRGIQNSSGYWSGAVGSLVRDTADLVVAPLSLSLERALAVDFAHPVEKMDVTVVVLRTAKRDRQNFMAYVVIYR